MLERCRIAGGLEPLRNDSTVNFTDGIDVDALLQQRLRSAYLRMLDEAPLELLAPQNIAGDTAVLKEAAGDGVYLSLPPECRRVVSVRLYGWDCAAAVAGTEQTAALIRRQLNPFTRASSHRPAAALVDERCSGKAAQIMCWPSDGTLVQIMSVIAVVDPGEERYVLDEAGMDKLCRQVVTDAFNL